MIGYLDKHEEAAMSYYLTMPADSRTHFEQWLQRECRPFEVDYIRLSILCFLARDTKDATYFLQNWTYRQIRDAALEPA